MLCASFPHVIASMLRPAIGMSARYRSATEIPHIKARFWHTGRHSSAHPPFEKCMACLPGGSHSPPKSSILPEDPSAAWHSFPISKNRRTESPTSHAAHILERYIAHLLDGEHRKNHKHAYPIPHGNHKPPPWAHVHVPTMRIPFLAQHDERMCRKSDFIPKYAPLTV